MKEMLTSSLASFPGFSVWAEKKEPGTHCLRQQCVPGSLTLCSDQQTLCLLHFLHVLHAEACPAAVYFVCFCLFLFFFVVVVQFH